MSRKVHREKSSASAAVIIPAAGLFLESDLRKSEKYTLMVLEGIFFLAAALAAWLGRLPSLPDALFIPALGLAAFRGGRAIAHNYIFKWLRDLAGVVETPDSSGAGNSNQAAGRGPRRVISELLCCPICAGTWVGMALLLIYSAWPAFALVLIYALAAAGAAEVLEWVSEYASWRGRAAREEAGTQWLRKNRSGEVLLEEEHSQKEISGRVRV